MLTVVNALCTVAFVWLLDRDRIMSGAAASPHHGLPSGVQVETMPMRNTAPRKRHQEV